MIMYTIPSGFGYLALCNVTGTSISGNVYASSGMSAKALDYTDRCPVYTSACISSPHGPIRVMAPCVVLMRAAVKVLTPR